MSESKCKGCCHVTVCDWNLKHARACDDYQSHICDRQRAKIEILEDAKGHFELKEKIARLESVNGKALGFIEALLQIYDSGTKPVINANLVQLARALIKDAQDTLLVELVRRGLIGENQLYREEYRDE